MIQSYFYIFVFILKVQFSPLSSILFMSCFLLDFVALEIFLSFNRFEFHSNSLSYTFIQYLYVVCNNSRWFRGS